MYNVTKSAASLYSSACKSRVVSSAVVRNIQVQRWNSTETSPKVAAIVDQIASLTLLETADLVSALKTKLNIKEIAMPVMQAPVAMAPPQAQQATPAAAEAPAEKAPEKSEFTLKLESFDAAGKAKVIKEIKNILPNMNLVEAKKFVESAPKVIKESVPKDEAEKLKKALEAAGAKITLE